MSTSRCIKLLHMMGLHRLDDPNAEFEMMPTILAPKDWVELEGMFAHIHFERLSTDRGGGNRTSADLVGSLCFGLTRIYQRRMADAP